MSLTTESARWEFLREADDELSQGGVTLSEWCCFITRETDIAFACGAFLPSIFTALSGIETYLRAEYSHSRRCRLVELIDNSPIEKDLKDDINKLRKYRNQWVHVDDPWDDEGLLERPEAAEKEIEEMAFFAARVFRRAVYENHWV